MNSPATANRTGLYSAFSFDVWSLTIVNNLDYFFFLKAKYWYSEQYVFLLDSMLKLAHWYEVEIQKLEENIERFDVDATAPGNGFRSFNIIFERCFNECYVFCRELCVVRDSSFFIAGVYLNKLKSHVRILEAFKPGLNHILKMIDENDSSLPLVVSNYITAEEIIQEYGLLDQTAFYGRRQGFYFCSSMRKTLSGVSVLMAAFSDLYQQSGGPLSRAMSAVLNGIKYIFDPDLRSQQIVTVAQNSSVEFLQAFWSLSETHFMRVLPRWICPALEVLEELWIPEESIVMNTEDGLRKVHVQVPSSHIPPAPVRCLLMSYVHRKGQFIKRKPACHPTAPFSPALLFHCHGGGFVSQHPETHEIYLRHWAHDLNVPILSVDYTLSPQAPFPRALEETFLAYVWALKNPEKLGWTGERICFVGDSAGGNLLMGIVIKCIALRIRKPDAILCAYSPLILDMIPSASRLLCWLDPLLPLGFMISCLDAYVGAMQTDNNEYTEKDSVSREQKRKVSSISDILDSSLMFLKDKKWADLELNESFTQDTSHDTETVDIPVFSPKISENNTEPVLILNGACEVEHYLNGFLMEYLALSEQYLHESRQSDGKEYLVYNFPQDLFYDIKHKYTTLWKLTGKKVNQVLQNNKWYKTYISPFIPANPFSSRTQEAKPFKVSIEQKIKRLKVVAKNPYISPLLVSEETLKEMPQIYFIALNFDPCLDDSITFAKRMTSIGKPAVVDVLDGLPHGFLNFLPFSKEAHDGSDVCVKRIKEALGLADVHISVDKVTDR